MALGFCPSLRGSPPRVRGKVVVTLYTTGEKGITPACAGKSVAVGHWAPLARDHPRVCGEKPCVARALSAAVGSPPRVRGKAFALNVCINSPGITPACAGKSMAQSWRLIAKWDHPRVCGEKKTFPTEVFTLLGSPPRVRGKGVSAGGSTADAGITPACAGKSFSRPPSGRQKGDHPRVCGEKEADVGHDIVVGGSPPRVRGKVYQPDV